MIYKLMIVSPSLASLTPTLIAAVMALDTPNLGKPRAWELVLVLGACVTLPAVLFNVVLIIGLRRNRL